MSEEQVLEHEVVSASEDLAEGREEEAGKFEHLRRLVDPAAGVLPPYSLVFVAPKTPLSRRLVRLSRVAVGFLHEQRERATGEIVFPNRFGAPTESSAVTDALKVALQRAGLPRIRVHDLRHTTATVLLEAGAHPKLVQDLLGHSTVALTLNTYSHITIGLGQEAAGMMDSLLTSR